jgi:tRNA threonylcarbamoyladenosine biosynthesis protein TsaB
MRILAIETIDKTGSVAALESGRLLAEKSLDPTRRSAQTLVPAIQQLLIELGWRPADVQLVAVATGPGSFAGLRIGVTTAKTFAYATGSQVLGIHTMLAIGWQVPPEIERFSAVVNAQRGEFFVADMVRVGRTALTGEQTTRIVTADTWLASLPTGSHVTGPGLVKWTGPLPEGVSAIARELWQPSAAAVGQLGHLAFESGQRSELLALAPQYFRRTAAEEQWDRRQATSE